MFSLMFVVLEVLFMSWMTQSQVDSYNMEPTEVLQTCLIIQGLKLKSN